MYMEFKADSKGNPVVDQFSEDGFVDLVFRIHDLFELEDRYRFRMAACYDGQTVGMDVSVVKRIGPGLDGDMNLIAAHVYRQGVRFYRTGPESDRLVSALAALYALDDAPRQMVDNEAFTAIALHQGDKDMACEPIKVKLFGNDGESDAEDDYYESFFNLDLANGFVFWNEKDQDYREPLLRSLSRLR